MGGAAARATGAANMSATIIAVSETIMRFIFFLTFRSPALCLHSHDTGRWRSGASGELPNFCEMAVWVVLPMRGFRRAGNCRRRPWPQCPRSVLPGTDFGEEYLDYKRE